MTTTHRLRIGEVAQRTGIAVGALRYYEGLGLLQSVRGDNGYRYYAPEMVQQVQFIKKAQALGFSLDDIGEILTVHQRGNVPCDFVQELLQTKIQQIDSQIQEMMALKTDLEAYRDRWAAHEIHPGAGDICPLIETVSLDRKS